MPIDYDLVKTVVCMNSPVLVVAGSESLGPRYKLVVPWNGGEDVYDFLSFREFRLDMRRMILDELEETALWIAVVAFAFSVPLDALRRLTALAGQQA